MHQLDFSSQEGPSRQARNYPRRLRLGLMTLILTVLSASCSSLVKSKDNTIPKLYSPLAEAKFEELIKQLQPFTNLKSLRTSQAYLLFQDAEASERYRYEADSTLVLQRPDKIRLLIQAPGIRTKLADMTSESNHFKVAIFNPSQYRHFLIGTNDADYSKWLEKLKGKERGSALASARPFHFTEALMMRPLSLNDSRYVFGMEEALVDEPDSRPGAKKGARVLKSFYVISEVEAGPEGVGASRVRRRFWFDRANGARFARQQIFDSQGLLATEVLYSDYKKISPDSAEVWPSVIWVNRPHDGYSARLTFNEERFEINPELKPEVFTLENTEKMPETDLDKPENK
jgi:hypothetical protein